MSAPEQYERRWNRTPSGCLCRASLIWQRELHLGPQTQPANKCRLLKQGIHTHKHTQRHTDTPQKEFTLHTTQFKYIYMQEINWKTQVYLAAHCFPACTLTIKTVQLRRGMCYCAICLYSHSTTHTKQPMTTTLQLVPWPKSHILISIFTKKRAMVNFSIDLVYLSLFCKLAVWLKLVNLFVKPL